MENCNVEGPPYTNLLLKTKQKISGQKFQLATLSKYHRTSHWLPLGEELSLAIRGDSNSIGFAASRKLVGHCRGHAHEIPLHNSLDKTPTFV